MQPPVEQHREGLGVEAEAVDPFPDLEPELKAIADKLDGLTLLQASKLVKALEEDPGLSKVRGYAEDSGEGRWTVEAAIANAVPAPTIAASLFARFVSRQDESAAMQAVAAMRQQFGGHAVRAAEESPDVPPA